MVVTFLYGIGAGRRRWGVGSFVLSLVGVANGPGILSVVSPCKALHHHGVKRPHATGLEDKWPGWKIAAAGNQNNARCNLFGEADAAFLPSIAHR